MSYIPSASGNQPLTRIKRVPVYLATVITAAFGLGCVATAVLDAARVPPEYLLLSWPALKAGLLWVPFTNILISRPDFFTLFGLYFFYIAAVEVEKFFGRKSFLILFAIQAVVVPLVLMTAWILFGHISYQAGWNDLMIGTFIAFATLYPNADAFGFMPMKYMAFAGFVLVLMSHLPDHNWFRISSVALQSAVGFAFVRLAKGTWSLGIRFPTLRWPTRKPRLRVVQGGQAGKPASAVSDLDSILDKISARGLESLTTEEKATLRKARSALLDGKKD